MRWIDAFGGDLEQLGAYAWMVENADSKGRLNLSLRGLSRGLNWHPQKTSRFLKMLEYSQLYKDGIVTLADKQNKADKSDLVTADRDGQMELFAEPDRLNETPYSYPKPTPLPVNFKLPKSWGEWAMEAHGLSRDEVLVERDKFHGYWVDKSGTVKGRKKVWALTWRKWIASPYRQAPDQSVANTDGFGEELRMKYGDRR